MWHNFHSYNLPVPILHFGVVRQSPGSYPAPAYYYKTYVARTRNHQILSSSLIPMFQINISNQYLKRTLSFNNSFFFQKVSIFSSAAFSVRSDAMYPLRNKSQQRQKLAAKGKKPSFGYTRLLDKAKFHVKSVCIMDEFKCTQYDLTLK